MYLLKRIYSKGISKTVYYSHSTMYLLKRQHPLSQSLYNHHSHSTMYLLKPFDSETSHLNEVFTFHHVSIKTMDAGQQLPFKVQFTFHHVSIKTFASFVMNLLVFLFTFHHVSIKTQTWLQKMQLIQNSHSTMYLLKPCVNSFAVF